MEIKEIALLLRISVPEVERRLTWELGKETVGWRCGETAIISEGPHDCPCDSILCDLGEEVVITPKEQE
jgi:hypothetical protein